MPENKDRGIVMVQNFFLKIIKMRGSIVIVCIRAGARWEDGRKKRKRPRELQLNEIHRIADLEYYYIIILVFYSLLSTL